MESAGLRASHKAPSPGLLVAPVSPSNVVKHRFPGKGRLDLERRRWGLGFGLEAGVSS